MDNIDKLGNLPPLESYLGLKSLTIFISGPRIPTRVLPAALGNDKKSLVTRSYPYGGLGY